MQAYTSPPQNTFLSGLNADQTQAVQTTEGPLLVLAGAGTGKTRVLTTRIVHILAQSLAYPSQILAVTFTNKAAREMRVRIEKMIGTNASDLWLGTFHSLCLRIVRRHAEYVGLPKDFTIVDADDQLRVMKQLMKDANIDDKRYPPKSVLGCVQQWKDKAWLPEDVPPSAQGDSVYHTMYQAYQKRLQALGVVDFGDLIMLCIVLFKRNPDILADYHRRFRYLLVDEYQDTNSSQYLWLRLLAQGSHNICCVGDDDQSIYGWKGAEVDNILRFEKDFASSKHTPQIIRLQQNYRSTAPILGAASHLIANNKGRLGKTLHSNIPGDEKVKVVNVWNDQTEAALVAQAIKDNPHQVPHQETSILVRAGFQTRAFEEVFMQQNIPYRIVGGIRFYERMEIRDATAYIRAMLQPYNDLALERIINIPKRGIGQSTIQKLRDIAAGQNTSLRGAIDYACGQQLLPTKAHSALSSLVAQFDRWKTLIDADDHAKVVEILLQESGYIPMWENEKTPDAAGRVENLKELLSALQNFDSLEAFLEHVSLVMDNGEGDDQDKVNVMTIHSAKGLEFEQVFLPGWEEGIFPSQKTEDERGLAGLEEERRLAYVAITRAKRYATILTAANRMVYGKTNQHIPSRFIDELPEEHITRYNMMYDGGLLPQSSQPAASAKAKRRLNETPSIRTNQAGFAVGGRVFHQKFGYGSIKAMRDKNLTVAFGTGTKTILSDFVEKA